MQYIFYEKIFLMLVGMHERAGLTCKMQPFRTHGGQVFREVLSTLIAWGLL